MIAIRKIDVLQTVCFMIVVIVYVICLDKLSDFSSRNFRKEEIQRESEPVVWDKETIYIGKQVIELKQLYKELSECFGTTETLQKEILELYAQIEAAKVCSKANRYFNSLEEKYNEYTLKLEEIQKNIARYEEKCGEYATLIAEIPQFLTLYHEKRKEFQEEISPLLQVFKEEKEKVFEEEEEMQKIYETSKKIADDFFEEFFDLMCRLVSAEARGCPAVEQYYVANVVENRIEHDVFPDTLYAVVYSGAYEPTYNGGIDRPAIASVKVNMEAYLRGKVETEMPSNVVYQSKGIQGHGIWKKMPSGHYFCYY